MVVMISRSTGAPVPLGEYVPTADQRIVLRGVGWAGFQALLALRGERRRPRMAYLDGAVELMGASRDHEGIKGCIGRVLEAFCLERDIPFSTYGSWLLDDESEEAGVEPDECYVFGHSPREKQRPDLAIEVIWTSGGLDKLEIYRRLGVGEVWIWKDEQISVFVRAAERFERCERSASVPDIDLDLVARLALVEPTSDAIKQLRASLRA